MKERKEVNNRNTLLIKDVAQTFIWRNVFDHKYYIILLFIIILYKYFSLFSGLIQSKQRNVSGLQEVGKKRISGIEKELWGFCEMTVPLWLNAVVSSDNWLERRLDIDPGNTARN